MYNSSIFSDCKITMWHYKTLSVPFTYTVPLHKTLSVHQPLRLWIPLPVLPKYSNLGLENALGRYVYSKIWALKLQYRAKTFYCNSERDECNGSEWYFQIPGPAGNQIHDAISSGPNWLQICLEDSASWVLFPVRPDIYSWLSITMWPERMSYFLLNWC